VYQISSFDEIGNVRRRKLAVKITHNDAFPGVPRKKHKHQKQFERSPRFPDPYVQERGAV
jgi:hypothetical protein